MAGCLRHGSSGCWKNAAGGRLTRRPLFLSWRLSPGSGATSSFPVTSAVFLRSSHGQGTKLSGVPSEAVRGLHSRADPPKASHLTAYTAPQASVYGVGARDVQPWLKRSLQAELGSGSRSPRPVSYPSSTQAAGAREMGPQQGPCSAHRWTVHPHTPTHASVDTCACACVCTQCIHVYVPTRHTKVHTYTKANVL